MIEASLITVVERVLCTSRAGTVCSSAIYDVRDRGEIERGRTCAGMSWELALYYDVRDRGMVERGRICAGMSRAGTVVVL